MPRKLNLRMFLATVVFAIILIGPMAYSHVIDQDEIGIFTAGGLSLEEISGLETEASAEGRWVVERDDGVIGSYSNALIQYSCDAPTSGTSASNGAGTFDNITTNLTTFGDAYGFALFPVADCSGDGTVIAPLTSGTDQMTVFFNLSFEDILDTEVIRIVVHPESNVSFDMSSLGILETDPAPTIPTANYNLLDLVSWADEKPYETGDIYEIPLTTQDRLLLKTWGEEDPDHSYVIVLSLRGDPDDLEDLEGELVVVDIDLSKTREGLLTNENKMVMFNVIYILVGGFAVALASPWFGWDDITRGSKRLNRKGAQGTTGAIILLVIAGAIGLSWIWGGWTSITDAFVISLMPLTLATAFVTLTAFTTRGQTNRPMSLMIATGAGVLGWTLGLALQNSWMAYDKLYVAPFMDMFGGNFTSSAFAVTSAIAVIVQILGLGVMIYNIVTTIGTDEVAFVQ